jgi:hypothetical protein
VERIGRENYFANEFADQCDGSAIDKNNALVTERLLEDFGEYEWPIPGSLPDTDVILDLVEFFCRYAAKPTAEEFHAYCR